LSKVLTRPRRTERCSRMSRLPTCDSPMRNVCASILGVGTM
jgi:hypothetical protein